MKLNIHGSCAGTEPIKGWHHLSFSLEKDGKQYFFDAGENCGYSAYINGVDIAKTRRIIISHTHMDHVGGLANLLWYIRKLSVQLGAETCPEIDVHIPNLETWEGIMSILKNTEGNFKCNFKITPHEVCDGIVFEDDGIRVTAFHNNHLPHSDGEKWRSFSYLTEADGKKIFFTGDYGSVTDFAEKIKKHTLDLLLIETGHHTSEETAAALKNAGLFPKILGYIHNGEDVRNNPQNAISVTEKILGVKTMVFTDGTVFEL